MTRRLLDKLSGRLPFEIQNKVSFSVDETNGCLSIEDIDSVRCRFVASFSALPYEAMRDALLGHWQRSLDHGIERGAWAFKEDLQELLQGYRKRKGLLSPSQISELFQKIIIRTEATLPRVPATVVDWHKVRTVCDHSPRIFIAAAHPVWGVNDVDYWHRTLTYKMAFEAAGAIVTIKPPMFPYEDNDDAPCTNEPFIRDHAFLFEDKAFVMPNDYHLVTENRYFEKGIRPANLKIGNWFGQQVGHALPYEREGHIDGGNILYDACSHSLFVGGDNLNPYLHRSLKMIIRETHAPVHFVRMKNTEMFFHLDLAMAILPKGEIILNVAGIEWNSLILLRQELSKRTVIEINEHNPYLCNLVAINQTIFPTVITNDLKKKFEQLGYDVRTARDLGLHSKDAIFNDGGLHCITNEIHRRKKELELRS